MTISKFMPSSRNYAKWCFYALLILFLLRAVTMAFLPLTEPSEPRYANICVNMAKTDNFVEPKLIHKGEMTTFDGKPPLYFQMGGIACKIFGYNEFSVRLPALLCGILILLITFFTVRKLSTSFSAWMTTLLLGATPFFYVFCGISLTDMTLCVSITGALCSYMLFSAAPDSEKERFSLKKLLIPSSMEKFLYSNLFFLFLGIGMLAKGPVAILLSAMPLFFYVLFANKWKDLKNHSWITGILLALAVAAPWYCIMQYRDHEFLYYFFVNENFKRFLFKEYGDKFGSGREFFRGMALIWFIMCNALAVLLLAWQGRNRERRMQMLSSSDFKNNGNPLIAISVLTVLTNTLFWSLTSRIPCYYLLPTIPMMAIACVAMLERTKFFDKGRAFEFFCLFCVIAGILALVGTAGYVCIAKHITVKYPQEAFSMVMKIKKENPEYADTKVYILRKNPYNAEFYLGDDVVVRHKNEDAEESFAVAMKMNTFLLITEDDIKKKLKNDDPVDGCIIKGKYFPPRKLLGKAAGWCIYAPCVDKNTLFKDK